MQLSIFSLQQLQLSFGAISALAIQPLCPYRTLVGSNGLFGIWLLRNQVALAHFSRASLAGLWWAQMDSDHRPHAYQACALTS